MKVWMPAKILEMRKGRAQDRGEVAVADELIKGGKRMPVGTVADWGGQKFRKVSEGKWQPVTGDGGRTERPGGGGPDKPGGQKEGAVQMTTEDKEDMASDYVSTPAKLSHRFTEAINELGDAAKKKFQGGKVDFEKKQFISKDGAFALQWQTRFNPKAPEGEGNKQSIKGAVKVVKLGEGAAPAKSGAAEAAKGTDYAARDAERKQASREKMAARLGYKKSLLHRWTLGRKVVSLDKAVPLFGEELEKGRSLAVGTVRDWKGEKYRKVGPGDWQKVKGESRAAHGGQAKGGGAGKKNKPVPGADPKAVSEKPSTEEGEDKNNLKHLFGRLNDKNIKRSKREVSEEYAAFVASVDELIAEQMADVIFEKLRGSATYVNNTASFSFIEPTGEAWTAREAREGIDVISPTGGVQNFDTLNTVADFIAFAINGRAK